MIILVQPPSMATTILVPYMGVVLASIYLVFAFRRFLGEQPRSVVSPRVQQPESIGS
jgi:hypothetical protein